MKRTLPSVLGATAIAVSACGVGAVERMDSQPEAPATETSEPAADAQETTQADSTAPKTTQAGARLKIGDQAVLPHKDGSIAVTVTAVDRGNRAAFERRYGQRAQGIDPYYIRFTVENVDGSDLSFTSAPALQLMTADGRSAGAVVTGSMPDCKRQSAPKGFAKAGASFESCRLTAARSGVDIVGARYNQDDYRDDPVVWRQ